MKKFPVFISLILLTVMSCNPESAKEKSVYTFQLVTLDPGHFHAALVQKSGYPNVDTTVYVYAPEGTDLQLHLDRINSYNNRTESPTNWNEVVYTGTDFFDKMIGEKKGNIVVLSGNNRRKSEYILHSIRNGFNVLADKPMVINSEGFQQLLEGFQDAEKNKLLLYDIMTERFEITTMLQRELSMLPVVFGTLEKGTVDNPAITKESIHHFYKYVSGNILTRPAWFFDASQQGEGIVDVMTHLVDLVQWECFPEQTLDYKNDVRIEKARRWATDMSLSEFKAITKTDSFPSYLTPNRFNDSMLHVYSNGEINYQLKGVHAKTSVIWKYKAPEGTGDTHYSIMRGTKANLIIRQGAEQEYKPRLYLEPVTKESGYETALQEEFKKLQVKFPGLELSKTSVGWEVIIPEKYKEGHEAHFARVTEKFLEYLDKGNMPAWEVPNMITKYYTTTKGLELAIDSGK